MHALCCKLQQIAGCSNYNDAAFRPRDEVCCAQWHAAQAALGAAAARAGYASWPHAMAQLAPALASAWVATGGTITDLASCAFLLAMPADAHAMDAEGWRALPQTGLPHAVHSSAADPTAAAPIGLPSNASSAALLSDEQLFGGDREGLADPGKAHSAAVLSSAHLREVLPQSISSQDAHGEELLQEVRDGKKVRPC